VDNGADAVYLGFRDDANARHFAGLNFESGQDAPGYRVCPAAGPGANNLFRVVTSTLLLTVAGRIPNGNARGLGIIGVCGKDGESVFIRDSMNNFDKNFYHSRENRSYRQFLFFTTKVTKTGKTSSHPEGSEDERRGILDIKISPFCPCFSPPLWLHSSLCARRGYNNHEQ
jgi:hypothetical protein